MLHIEEKKGKENKMVYKCWSPATNSLLRCGYPMLVTRGGSTYFFFSFAQIDLNISIIHNIQYHTSGKQ